MRAHILGSAAGGGFPQWNCACPNCLLVRAGDVSVRPRSQDSIAVTSAGERWLLVNASPDVARQVERFVPLHPRAPPVSAPRGQQEISRRHTPIAAIALTNGDLDHVLGLLSLREWQPLVLLATERVRAGLVERNAMMRTLARTSGQVTWKVLELGREVLLEDVGVGVTALPAPGKLPVHLVGLSEPSPEDNVALRIREVLTGRTIAIATSVGALEGVGTLTRGVDALLFDGTFWSEDELVSLGLGSARARDMAHVPIGGESGSLARLEPAGVARRVYTHINNTNPILRSGSPERVAVERAGWEVAFDGLEMSL
jgi:pyrroloquinoline quinone biosynthesis protein B